MLNELNIDWPISQNICATQKPLLTDQIATEFIGSPNIGKKIQHLGPGKHPDHKIFITYEGTYILELQGNKR